MDGQQPTEGHSHQPQQAAHAGGPPRDLSIDFIGVLGALLANQQVRAWLHRLLDTALDSVRTKADSNRPEGTVIWGSEPQS